MGFKSFKTIVIALGAGFSLMALIAFAWNDPGVNAPLGNKPEPLTAGNQAQAKIGGLYIKIQNSAAFGLRVFGTQNSGFVGINTNAPQKNLDLNGNFAVSGTIKPNNTPGLTGQILTNKQGKSMAWSNKYAWLTLIEYSASSAQPTPTPPPPPPPSGGGEPGGGPGGGGGGGGCADVGGGGGGGTYAPTCAGSCGPQITCPNGQIFQPTCVSDGMSCSCTQCADSQIPGGGVQAPANKSLFAMLKEIFDFNFTSKKAGATDEMKNDGLKQQIAQAPSVSCLGLPKPQTCESLGWNQYNLVCTELTNGDNAWVRNCYK